MRSTLCLAILAFATLPGWSQAPPRKRVAVFDFDNAAVEGTVNTPYLRTNAPDLGKGVSELLITKLVKDGNVSVIERNAIDKILAEQNLTNSDRTDPATAAKLGRVLGVDAIVLGTITHYDYDEKGKGGGGGARHALLGTGPSTKAKYDIRARVQISTRLISPDTAEVVAVSEGVGQTSRKGVKIDVRDTGGRLIMASGVNPVMNESMDMAIAQLAGQLERELAKLPQRAPLIEGLVADAGEAGQLVVNVGARNGVKVGDRLQILRSGKEIRDPVNGKVLMRDDTPLGEAIVTRVNDVSAVAQYKGNEPAKVLDVVKNIPATVNVNNDSARAEKQRINGENGQQIGQAIGKGLATAIQAAMLKHHNVKKEMNKGAQWCAAHQGSEQGFKMSDGLAQILGVSAYASCDDGKMTYHEPSWKQDLRNKTLTAAK